MNSGTVLAGNEGWTSMTRCGARNPRDRREVPDQIVVELEERCIDRVGCADLEQRVAVGRRPHDRFGGDIAGAPRPVVDDDGLTETLRQPLADQTREHVTGAAGREADHDAHRPRWIGLRPRSERHRRKRGSTRCQMQKVSAGKFYGIPSLSTGWPEAGAGQARRAAAHAPPTGDGYCTNAPNGARSMISMRAPQGSVM